MTRKDYIAIAKILATNRPQNETAYAVWRAIRYDFIVLLQRDNPRIDRERFLVATEGGR